MGKLPTRIVTSLFTDMEGSTLLLQQIGEHYAGILEVWWNLLRTTFQQYHSSAIILISCGEIATVVSRWTDSTGSRGATDGSSRAQQRRDCRAAYH